MFLPKGTRVVLGQCGLHYDDQRYPEPWRYNPSRYLGTKMLQKSAYENMFSPNYEEDRDHWGYGAGRRYCPGYIPPPSQLIIRDSCRGEIALHQYRQDHVGI
jgi:cytochrome P450